MDPVVENDIKKFPKSKISFMLNNITNLTLKNDQAPF